MATQTRDYNYVSGYSARNPLPGCGMRRLDDNQYWKRYEPALTILHEMSRLLATGGEVSIHHENPRPGALSECVLTEQGHGTALDINR